MSSADQLTRRTARGAPPAAGEGEEKRAPQERGAAAGPTFLQNLTIERDPQVAARKQKERESAHRHVPVEPPPKDFREWLRRRWARVWRVLDPLIGITLILLAAGLLFYTVRETLVVTGFTSLFHGEKLRNEYAGTKIEAGEGCARISYDEIPSSETFFRDFVHKRRPVIITAASSASTSSPRAPDSLFERLGWQPSMLRPEAIERECAEQGVWLTFRRRQEDGRLAQAPLDRLSRSWSIPHFYHHTPVFAVDLTLGTVNEGSSLSTWLFHEDTDELSALLRGEASLTLFSPADVFNLYSHVSPDRVSRDGAIVYGVSKILAQQTAHYSQVLPGVSDLSHYPRFRSAASAQCTVKEGEMVYIPHGWFRQWTYRPLSKQEEVQDGESTVSILRFLSPYEESRHTVPGVSP